MKKVIVALPGREYSGAFLMNWSQTLLTLIERGYTVKVVNEYSSFVSFSRMKTLGLDVLRVLNKNHLEEHMITMFG